MVVGPVLTRELFVRYLVPVALHVVPLLDGRRDQHRHQNTRCQACSNMSSPGGNEKYCYIYLGAICTTDYGGCANRVR